VAGRLQAKIGLKIFFSGGLLFLMACTANERADSFVVNDAVIQSGDIVFRRSYGIVSDLIVARLNDSVSLSHCGIAYRDSAGQLFVIHALSKKLSDTDGMQQCSFEAFLQDSRPGTVKVTRFLPDTSGVLQHWAIQYLKNAVPFDDTFDMRDTTSFFCTELALHIIQTHFDVDLGQANDNSIPKFSTLFKKPYFIEIDLYQK
jgi:hypothetical protein